MQSPFISVVIPTCNRRRSLERLLRALERDTSAPSFEVIIVDDGSADDTAAALREWCGMPLTVIETVHAGPAGARNAGAAVARGRVLVFFDDDVEPLPGTLGAHAALHEADTSAVGIGDLPPVVCDQSLFGIILRGWWQMMLREIRNPFHRFSFRNVLTGHLSVNRARFAQLGGFDANLRCHEDWDFGYRALTAGLDLTFVEGAIAWHHESSDLSKACRRKFDEGVADVQLARKHAGLAHAFPLAWPLESRRARALKTLTRSTPSLASAAAWYLSQLLPLYESVKLRFRWRSTLELLLVHHYWRGVFSVSNREELRRFGQTKPAATVPALRVDLEIGIEQAAEQLDRTRPSSVILMLGDTEIGRVNEWPGLERLRGAHLRPLLARAFKNRFLEALHARGTLPRVLVSDAIALSHASDGTRRAQPPVVRDEQLAGDADAALDVKHRAAVPPVHHVA